MHETTEYLCMYMLCFIYAHENNVFAALESVLQEILNNFISIFEIKNILFNVTLL